MVRAYERDLAGDVENDIQAIGEYGLKLVKSQSFPTGVIVANYRPDGAVKTGDFQLAEPSEAELERRRNLT